MWLEYQSLAGDGYTVFFANPRGSDGYGFEVKKAIHRNWGNLPMGDVLAGADTVIARGLADRDKQNLTPIAYVANMHTPLLLLHGEQDQRVSLGGVQTLFRMLKAQGKEVQLVLYPREGHEVTRSGEPAHRVDHMARILDWFDTH